ncbi:quorum-sensing phosphorelay protein LuxU [Vibrio atypicus]|uniref:quorum-sensing phosphorelay protein LuxU n=1 Tax=Vibrio atypicus TaxID=558271 RepID=UPI001576114A|nr:quorum-sensing phosphorelay protein LuxU [Vibrio atypicus]
MMDVLNQDKIDRLASEIGADNVPILLDIFLGELAQYMSKLTSDPDLDVTSYLKEISHALKSSAASFGAESLCAYAIEIDSMAKAGQAFDLDLTKQNMIALLKETEQRYQELVAQ